LRGGEGQRNEDDNETPPRCVLYRAISDVLSHSRVRCKTPHCVLVQIMSGTSNRKVSGPKQHRKAPLLSESSSLALQFKRIIARHTIARRVRCLQAAVSKKLVLLS
ncbi:unnamed protein product, partial [Ectocarpus sp. 12 AP-2014]